MVAKKARYRFVFDRKKKAEATGKGLIELFIYLDPKNKKYISTKIRVAPQQWDAKYMLINSKNSNYIEKNITLGDMLDEIEKYELQLINNNKLFTIDKLTNFLKSQGQELTFTSFWQKMMDEDMSILPASKRPQKRALELLTEFAGVVMFNDINFSFVNDFDKFLHEKQFATNTIWRIHKDLRKYINLAINYEHFNIANYPYRKFKVVKDQNKHLYLNYSELAAIEQANLSGVENIATIRDMFLLQCYTGLRYSDVHILNHTNIEQRAEGLVITLDRMKKVNRRIFLRLYELFDGKPQTIVKKYLAAHPQHKYLFGQFVSNTKMNGALKVIQHETGIRKDIKSHVGRHTFGTLYAHKTGSIFDVMKIMGISKFETAQIYINLSEEL